jgi:effector-binding domain-containing protein
VAGAVRQRRPRSSEIFRSPITSHVVTLTPLDGIPLAVVRRRASPPELARLVPECCGLVWNAVRMQATKAGRHVAIYWDSGIRLEVGVEISGPFVEDGELVRSATPAGLVASTTHFGPYGGLGTAHDAIRRWCASHNHRLAGPNWEIYGHWQGDWDANPSRIRTDVFYLVSGGTDS